MTAERKYWNPEIETMPIDKLKSLQEERLQTEVSWAYDKSAFYRRKFDEAGIRSSDIKSLNDLQKLPFTTTEEFRAAPLSDRLGVPFDELKWIGSTSGTTGFPDIIPFTERDREILLQEAEPRFRWSLGVRPHDVIQILSGFECCLMGCPNLGATMLRGDIGRGNLDYQIRLAQMAGVTVVEHLPSLLIGYFERAKELGIDIKESKVRMVIGVGEGWAEARKRKFEDEYGIVFRAAAYGSMEVGAAATQCEEGKGMHIFGEFCLAEVIDPETLAVLPPGKEGEVVLTPLLNQALPLIRYRTNDVGAILPYEPCPCGRTHPKMSMVKGRISQIIKVDGKKILPIDIEEVIPGIEGLAEDFQIIVDRPGELDRLKVKIECKPGVKDLAGLKDQVEGALRQNLGVETEVELLPMGSTDRTSFKAKRIVTTY